MAVLFTLTEKILTGATVLLVANTARMLFRGRKKTVETSAE